MKNELKELVVAYVKADSEVESQKSRLSDLNRAKDAIADNLTNRIHEAIEVEDFIYLDYGDGILYCSNHDKRMHFERINTIDVDDLKPLKPE